KQAEQKDQPDKEQTAEKYLEGVLKQNPALKLYTMPVAKSPVVLLDELERRIDPKLTESLEPLRQRMSVANDSQFVATLFNGTGTYDPKRATVRFAMQGFQPEFETVEVLWWRKEDTPARVPRSLSEPGVRDKVVLAWKMDQALALASDQAQKLTEEINK